MRIAILIDALTRGGAERQALAATLELTRAGHDVELIYYHDFYEKNPKYEHVAFDEAKVTFLPKGSNPIAFLWRLIRHLKRGRFEILHGFKGAATLYAAPAGRMARIPVVLGGYRVEFERRGKTRLMYRAADRMLDGWVVNAQVIAESMTQAVGVAPRKFFIVHNGIEPQAFASELTPAQAKARLGLAEDCPTASIVAVMRPQKNHGLFLEMAARVHAIRPQARFLIIGGGPLQESLESHARKLGIFDAVLFLGHRSDIRDLLAATDVSLLTSHYEGLANALLESMAVGIPVISTDYNGVEELVTDGEQGFIVPRGDADALARQVCRLLDDAPLRKKLGETGRRTVEKRFTMAAMAANLAHVYETALGRKVPTVVQVR